MNHTAPGPFITVDEAVRRFEAFASERRGGDVSPVDLDRFLQDTLCCPGIGVPSAKVLELARRFTEYGDSIRTCVGLNDIVGVGHARRGQNVLDRLSPGDAVGSLSDDGERRYLLEDLLGRGRGGAVYRATDRLLSSDAKPSAVAMKVIAACEASEARQLLDEARLARRVSHVNVAKVFDAGYDDDHAFVVSELLEGPSLSVGGRLRWREVARLVAQLADGVAAIHAAGLVHGDLKPANVIMRDAETPVIVDFGSAAHRGSGRAQRGGFTLAFCAPEQLSGGSVPIPASDVYSLGSIAVWLLLGQPAAGDSAPDVIRSHVGTGRDRVGRTERQLRSRGVPSDLCAVIARATARDPRHRYAGAHALAEDLRRIARHRPVEWTVPSPLKRGVMSVRRRPVASSLAIVALIAAAGGLVMSHRAHYLSRAVVEQQTIAAVERARVESERAWKVEAGTKLRELMTVFGRAQARGMNSQVLFSLWLLEWTHGEGVLSDPGAVEQVWNQRIEILQDLQREHPESLLSRLADPSLTLWLILRDRPDEAAMVADRAIAYAEPLVSSEDPWLSRLRLLRDVAQANADDIDPMTRGAITDSLRVRYESGQLRTLPGSLQRHVAGLLESSSL
ncbi:MAG: serine/threonine-protein kinase [Planctomycetota bacterium]